MSMKNQIRLLLAILILASAALACASPLGGNDGSGPSPEAVSTAVALTFQALTPADSTVTEALEPAAGLLPHSLYYLGNDNAGLTQVFRIEKDGKTIEQVTSEPVNVTYYSVSPVDGSVAYVANYQLVLVSADGSGRRVLVDGGVEVGGYLTGKSAIHIARTYRGKDRNFSGEHFWARGYFVSTVGADEHTVREYIRDQEEEDIRLDQLQLFK